VKIGSRTTLRGVALAVGSRLAESGIRAVLTGGACASLHSGGAYLSEDLDFVILGSVTVRELDDAMSVLGFRRKANRYEHPGSRFWVEFPRGPLGIGADLDVSPVRVTGREGSALALSATDSCRDRLAAFFHWGDRQSLEVALRIALRNEVNLAAVERWSDREGHLAEFRAFARELVARKRKL
jgi:hypothetical protein